MTENRLLETETDSQRTTTLYRFDVFLGEEDSEGKIEKIRSVGVAFVREGLSTYSVQLKTLLKDRFYLIRGTTKGGPDFVLVTREDSRSEGRRYFWNVVGSGECLTGINDGTIELKFDLFGENIYMTESPTSSTRIPANDRDE